jgi:hypothetical protein
MPIITFMLHCERMNAAMQTEWLPLASGIHKLASDREALRRCTKEKATSMSKTASIRLAPSSTLLGRLMAAIDRLLMASARIAIRNGDLPHIGL